jgi:pyrroline-5-carboxylate reductase
MARALIGGLRADGWPASSLWVADPDPDQRQSLLDRYPAVQVGADNNEAAKAADVVLLAVKPQVLKPVAQALAECVQLSSPLIVTIAAGIRTVDLERWLGGNLAIVRCMPNTPALVRSAATALYANARVAPDQRAAAEMILNAVGITLWIEDEALLDAVTALSGSGPAYFLLVIEAMERAGVKLGLTAEVARQLTLQTALGTARLALAEPIEPAVLRARVTSKGGTTERAIAELEGGRLKILFEHALAAAAKRAGELARDFAEKA